MFIKQATTGLLFAKPGNTHRRTSAGVLRNNQLHPHAGENTIKFLKGNKTN